jgi:hypothetical protein
MSGEGAPTIGAESVGVRACHLRVALVTTSWHAEVMRA